MKHRFTFRHIILTLLPGLLLLGAVLFLHLYFGQSMKRMFADVTAIAGVHPATGFVSNLGILLWCASAAVSGFAAFLVRAHASRQVLWFLLASALLSAYLMLDDLFQIHDYLAIVYLGLDEKVVLSTVALLTLVYLVAFRRVILGLNYSFLLLAVLFFGISLLIDVFAHFWIYEHLSQGWSEYLEDGCKWLGIVCWFSYHWHASRQLAQSVFTPAGGA